MVALAAKFICQVELSVDGCQLTVRKLELSTVSRSLAPTAKDYKETWVYENPGSKLSKTEQAAVIWYLT